MIKKLIFFGCSVTAGNELYEEAHVPNYKSMSFEAARKVLNSIPEHEVEQYQLAHSFPCLTAKKLGVEFENHGIAGVSNQEIASRAFTYFPDADHSGTVVVLQLTTHNRMFIKYREENNKKTVGSFVVHPKITDDRLTRQQNNLLKEMFFEFFEESTQSLNDHIYMFYAAEALKKKGIKTYILWPNRNTIQWGDWEHTGVQKDNGFINDREPQFMNKIGNYFVSQFPEYDILSATFNDLVPENSLLPRFHYNQTSHEIIATKLSEKLTCLNG